MKDGYEFWRAQLNGEKPETTPGTPHAGFYLNPWRESYPNPSPTVGGPRRKVRIIPGVSAIWKDGDNWFCRTDTPEIVKLVEGQDAVDDIFSRVCRNAIPHEKYTEEVFSHEQHRNNRTEDAADVGERGPHSGDNSAVDGGCLSTGKSGVHGGDGPEGLGYA